MVEAMTSEPRIVNQDEGREPAVISHAPGSAVADQLARLRAEVRELQRANRTLGARNTKLAQLLKSSRDKLGDLNEQLDALAQPPSTYGTVLEASKDPGCMEVFTAGRRMRLAVAPFISRSELRPGITVRLGEGQQIVEAAGFTPTGELATVVDLLGAGRAIVVDSAGQRHVVRLAEPVRDRRDRALRAGDALLIDPKIGYAFEAIPRSDVATLALEEVPDVTYADIGGLDGQIGQIQDAVELPFSHPDLYRSYHLHPPKGVLLYGPPGCGKTLIAKAVANSLSRRAGACQDAPSYFLNIKGPELLNKYVGETERQIRAIFERARELATEGNPVIVFFDEMESIFRTRGSGRSSDMETTAVPQLLTELDGVEKLSNVIVIGATNREELIDPAILRPGRLDIKIRVDRPDREGAHQIFARYLRGDIPLALPAADLIQVGVTELFAPKPYVELTLADGSTLVLNYSDFVSGAMIANIVDRAKKAAIKDHLSGLSHAGIAPKHLITAVAAEERETEDLPNTSNPDEWTRIIGHHGQRVKEVRRVGASVG